MHWNTSIRTAPSAFAALRRDFDRNPGLDSASSFGAMTVLESADHWTVEVDVPGALLADIEITLTDGSLVIGNNSRLSSRHNDSIPGGIGDRDRFCLPECG